MRHLTYRLTLSNSSNEAARPHPRCRDAGVPPAWLSAFVDRADRGGRRADAAGAIPSLRVQGGAVPRGDRAGARERARRRNRRGWHPGESRPRAGRYSGRRADRAAQAVHRLVRGLAACRGIVLRTSSAGARSLSKVCRALRCAGRGDDRAVLPPAKVRAGPWHDAAKAVTVHRDGDQRRQIRPSRHAAGLGLPRRPRHYGAHAGHRRDRAVAGPGNVASEKIRPPETWRPHMSTMTINGRAAPLPNDPDALLIDVVRGELNLTGTKLVCGAGVCGACTVLVDGAPVVSCLMPAGAAAGKSVTTIEGIGAAALHPVQQAFMAHDALQCGFCTPGFVVEAAAFCDRWRAAKGNAVPSREEIAAALSGHLCRCGAYDGIFNAVAAACGGQFDGRNVAPPRVEARDKVTGAAKYTVDIRHDGQLEGVILRSPIPHGRIAKLDLAPALALPGVAAAVSLLGDDRMVRYIGYPIAAVAAKDRKTALTAIAAIKFSNEPLPAVIGLDAARKQDAPVVFDKASRKKAGNVSEGAGGPAAWKGNVRGPSAAFSQKAKKARGWIDGARAA